MTTIGDVFVKDNVAINANGVAMRNNPKTFTLAYSDLNIGKCVYGIGILFSC